MSTSSSLFNLILIISTQVIILTLIGVYSASVTDRNDSQIFNNVGFENLDEDEVILHERSENSTTTTHTHTTHKINEAHVAKWFGISLAVMFGVCIVITIPLLLLYFYYPEDLYRILHCDWDTRSQSEEPNNMQVQDQERIPPEYYPSEPSDLRHPWGQGQGHGNGQPPPAYRIASFSSHHVADRVRRVDRARTAWVRFWAYRHYHIPCRGQDNPPTYFESMLNVNLMEGTTTGETAEESIELNVIGRTYSRRSSV